MERGDGNGRASHRKRGKPRMEPPSPDGSRPHAGASEEAGGQPPFYSGENALRPLSVVMASTQDEPDDERPERPAR
jgi:hypothetical protein